MELGTVRARGLVVFSPGHGARRQRIDARKHRRVGVGDMGVSGQHGACSGHDQYMPPPMPPIAAAPGCADSGISEMTASVVSRSEAMDAAFCSAERTTLVGSITPAWTRFS